jgi:hypothetical protein
MIYKRTDCRATKYLSVLLTAPAPRTTWNTSSVDQILSGCKEETSEERDPSFAVTQAVPGTQIFLTTVKNGLGLHPWVKTKSRQILCHLLKGPKLTEISRPVSVLCDFDKAGDRSMLDKLQVGPLGNVAKKLPEDQKLQRCSAPSGTGGTTAWRATATTGPRRAGGTRSRPAR